MGCSTIKKKTANKLGADWHFTTRTAVPFDILMFLSHLKSGLLAGRIKHRQYWESRSRQTDERQTHLRLGVLLYPLVLRMIRANVERNEALGQETLKGGTAKGEGVLLVAKKHCGGFRDRLLAWTLGTSFSERKETSRGQYYEHLLSLLPLSPHLKKVIFSFYMCVYMSVYMSVYITYPEDSTGILLTFWVWLTPSPPKFLFYFEICILGYLLHLFLISLKKKDV